MCRTPSRETGGLRLAQAFRADFQTGFTRRVTHPQQASSNDSLSVSIAHLVNRHSRYQVCFCKICFDLMHKLAGHCTTN